ncbi:hypothetical protein FSP39_019299 [Pinctada imbricata]|uniref:C-type lectin domain-containing protein n=1 Tax=Pinctada imbricata TaxID=66713 RepID=A0AA88Y374_PINIB|nr:hypothetical protein FSP39_019299 [Pinctada imbricata]
MHFNEETSKTRANPISIFLHIPRFLTNLLNDLLGDSIKGNQERSSAVRQGISSQQYDPEFSRSDPCGLCKCQYGSGGQVVYPGAVKSGVVLGGVKSGGLYRGSSGGGKVLLGGGGAAHGVGKVVIGGGGVRKGGVVVGGKASYPHGNVQSVGGHGYFPDEAPGLSGYGKGVIYRRVQNVAPLALSCPFGWTRYHDSCYYFSRDKLSWFRASMKCAYMGGYLAVVNYAHENSFLKLMAKKNHLHEGAWFGLNDVLFPKTHTWYWGYGKKGCKWFDWFGKGPRYGRGGDNNCACFKEDYHYQWAVSSCASKLYYICELKPVINLCISFYDFEKKL